MWHLRSNRASQITCTLMEWYCCLLQKFSVKYFIATWVQSEARTTFGKLLIAANCLLMVPCWRWGVRKLHVSVWSWLCNPVYSIWHDMIERSKSSWWRTHCHELSVPMKADLRGLHNFSVMIYPTLAPIQNTSFPGGRPSGIEEKKKKKTHKQVYIISQK